MLGDQGSSYAKFGRPIELGNVIPAEAAGREFGNLRLIDALELTALIAKKDRPRSRRMAARWLER